MDSVEIKTLMFYLVCGAPLARRGSCTPIEDTWAGEGRDFPSLVPERAAQLLIEQEWATAAPFLSPRAENFSQNEILGFLKVFLSFRPPIYSAKNSYLLTVICPLHYCIHLLPTLVHLSGQLSLIVHVLICLLHIKLN